MSGRLCIVCGRPIPKRTESFYFQEPRAAVPERKGQWHTSPALEAIPEGTREGNTFYVARENRPNKRAELAHYTNHTVTSVSRGADGSMAGFSTWDGESYVDEHFCTNKCAMRQGYASAQHGERYTWKSKGGKS